MTDLDSKEAHGQTSTTRMCKDLRSLAVDSPDDGFSFALHRRLMAEPTPAAQGILSRASAWLRERRAWLWPAAGLASGLAAYGLLVVLHGPAAREHAARLPRAIATEAVLPSFRIPSSKVAIIKLSFNAEVAVEDVTFQVTLPEGLYFWSGGERLAERSFRWPGRLDAGENVVPVAVRGDVPGRYPVIATVEVDGRKLEQRVIMDVHKERS